MTSLAVIIPALNEEEVLAATLAQVHRWPAEEVIVADGASTDDTAAVARRLGATVVKAPRGRARQMNAGARQARADILFFLHADSLPPPDYPNRIRAALRQPGTIAGAFSLAIASRGRRYRMLETLVRLRCRILALPYGDQGLFLQAETFRRSGCFPDVPFLEDLIYVRHLKRRGKIAVLPDRIQTSARRWQRHGVVKTTLVNQVILLGYACGIPPEHLGRFYRRL